MSLIPAGRSFRWVLEDTFTDEVCFAGFWISVIRIGWVLKKIYAFTKNDQVVYLQICLVFEELWLEIYLWRWVYHHVALTNVEFKWMFVSLHVCWIQFLLVKWNYFTMDSGTRLNFVRMFTKTCRIGILRRSICPD